MRRLVLAKDDPAKQRIRAWLSDVDDERLLHFGLTSQDIAALRGTVSRPADMTIAQALVAPAEDSGASRISSPIAGCTDDLRRCPFSTDEVNTQDVTLETQLPVICNLAVFRQLQTTASSLPTRRTD